MQVNGKNNAAATGTRDINPRLRAGKRHFCHEGRKGRFLPISH